MASNEYRELVKEAIALGLVDDGIDGAGHHRFRNAETGAFTSLSTTGTHTGRGPNNARAALRRVAGVDNRGREAVEGERRERKPRKRLGSGFNLEKAVKYIGRTPHRDMGPDRDAIAAEREAVYLDLLTNGATYSDAKKHRLAKRVIDLDSELEALKRHDH